MAAELTETQIVTLTLWGEARGEPIEGRIAVGCVIRNRVDTGYRGRTYREVCLAPWQFSCWMPQGGKENYDAVMAVADLLASQQESAEAFDPVLRECGWIAHGIIGRWIRDRVRQARHYHVTSMTPVPAWAIGHAPVCEVANHLFYAGVK